MRPVRLVVEGLTSFRKAQEIDFRQFGLFVITGATGSGKTSILDAVTLALYGMVPRGGKQDVKELVSLGASQAAVQLDFRVKETNYRVARRIRRQGAQSATLERIEGEIAVSEVDRGGIKPVNDRIVEILGLDYQSFTTAVLLPQGDFAAFLKGDVKLRRRILIRLLDLDRFERAGKLAREKAKELRAGIRASDDLVSQEYGDVTNTALQLTKNVAQEAEQRAVAIKAAYDEARSNLAKREEIGARHQRIQELIATIAEQETKLEELASTSKKQGVRSAQALLTFRAAERSQSQAEKARSTARKAWKETVEETGTEGVLATLKAIADSAREANQDIKRRTEELGQNAEALNEATSQAAALEVKRESAATAEVEAAQAHEVATEGRDSAEDALRAARRAEEVGQDFKAKAAKLESLRSKVAGVKAQRQEARADREQKQSKFRVVETAHRAAGLRAHLDRGDECPVCGASIEELPPTDSAIESVLAAHESAAQEAQETVVIVEKELSALRAKLEGAESDVKALQRQLSHLEDLPSVKCAEKAKASADGVEMEAKKRLEKAKGRRTAILAEIADSKVKLAGLEATRTAARQALNLARKRVEAADRQLRDGLGESLPEPVEKEIGSRLKRLQKATEARDAAETDCDSANQAYREAAEARRAATDDLADLDRQRGHHRTLLGERSEQLRRLKLEVPSPPPPVPSEDREAETEDLRAYAAIVRERAREQTAQVGAQLEELDASIRTQASKADVDAALLDSTAATSALEEAAQEARRTADQSAKDVASLHARLKRKAQMQAEIKKNSNRMHQYEKVANELKTDRFIGFLLDESIGDLALRASNELLGISANQYSLTSSKNNFTVVDHANADEHRSVVTLSGGETFLASLALALALARGIADIAGHSAGARLDAMFIDEGFGMLDPESLDQAVEALEKLQDGERMVGIITHVPTLAERIPDGLRVERKVEGSVVGVR